MKVDIEKLKNGDRRSLAKAITLIESTLDNDVLEAQELLEKVLPLSGKSMRVGITGVPGVGKSTFIETYGLKLIEKGHKVAVLAIDPSSPLSGGSILGDKTRMEHLCQEENSFIRPTPSSGFLGGVAQKTRESILLCEAAGFDYILVETVGVGQSEFEAADMVDFFAVLMLPNAGDELQGIKKGILELADSIIINKADGEFLKKAINAQAQYTSALEIVRANPHWKPQVLHCSSIEKKNFDLVYEMVENYRKAANNSGYFEEKRNAQNRDWFKKLINELFNQRLKKNAKLAKAKYELEAAVSDGQILPLAAARKYIDLIFKRH